MQLTSLVSQSVCRWLTRSDCMTNSVKITLLVSETVACFLHQNRKMHPGVANNVRFIRHDVSVISNACQNLPHKFRFEQDCTGVSWLLSERRAVCQYARQWNFFYGHKMYVLPCADFHEPRKCSTPVCADLVPNFRVLGQQWTAWLSLRRFSRKPQSPKQSVSNFTQIDHEIWKVFVDIHSRP
jgi:hypothetical protein